MITKYKLFEENYINFSNNQIINNIKILFKYIKNKEVSVLELGKLYHFHELIMIYQPDEIRYDIYYDNTDYYTESLEYEELSNTLLIDILESLEKIIKNNDIELDISMVDIDDYEYINSLVKLPPIKYYLTKRKQKKFNL